MIGRVHERIVNVNLSDGGHIENLGLYELVRRRCEFIVVSDAEHDPKGQFTGLARAIRFLRIEMGIQVDIDLDFISKPYEKNGSGVPFAVGVIHYGPGKLGYLLYIKMSVSGDENVYVREYGIREREFPHETTGDQFFNEAQFEAYRALGYHIGNGIFSGTQDQRLKELAGRTGRKPHLYAKDWKEPLMQSLQRTGRTTSARAI